MIDEGTFFFSGVHLRVVPGYKAAMNGQDLRLDWLTPGGWCPVPMKAIAFMVAFMYENEERRYPSGLGYQGGEKFMRYLRDALKFGVDNADAALQVDRKTLSMFPRVNDDILPNRRNS